MTSGEPRSTSATILVALSNPETESALLTLAAAIARYRNGRVLAVHVVTVPDQTPLETAATHRDRLDQLDDRLLAEARRELERFEVPLETRTIFSHRGVEAVFDAAREHDADTLIMGYGGARLVSGRAAGALDELTRHPPCDVLILDAEALELSDVLIPTAGGGSSDLSAEVGRALQVTMDVAVSLLYVTEDVEAGEQFLRDWAAEHDLTEADLLVETGDVEETIAACAESFSLVIVGATERGLLSRVIRGSLAFDTIERLDMPVLLTERPRARSLRDRLFGPQ